MSTTSGTLSELVLSAARGDRSAQQELLTQYWPLITRAVRARKIRMGKRFSRRQDTQDLEQDAAIRILANLPQHEFRTADAFAGWIRCLAESQVVDTFRRHRAGKRDLNADTQLSRAADVARQTRGPETRLDERNRASALMREIDALKPDYGAALLMFHLGFTHAEIGHTLGCTAEGARKLVTRAHKKLIDLRLKPPA